MTKSLESSQNLPFPSESLSERQHAAVTLLISGKTYTAVADELGIDRRTLWEWRQLPAFSGTVEAELRAIHEETRTRMCALAERAVNAIGEVMENGYTDGERLAAVRLVLKWIDAERHQAP